MVSIRNLVLYLKGFSKHYSNHFIFSDYKGFLSSFSSIESKRSLKLKKKKKKKKKKKENN